MWVENHPFNPDPSEPPPDPNEPPLQPAKISLKITSDLLSLTALQSLDGSDASSSDLNIADYLGLTMHRPDSSETASNLGLSDFFHWDPKRLTISSIDKGFEVKGEGGPKWVGEYYAVLKLFKWVLKSPTETIVEYS